ncbi:phage tail assembly protein T [Hafnia alvei]|uniref:phage tail assembly protein T n=1 Tax=Hafnia alvei TaxID=569 RepID=UPI0010330BE0|nr:DUF4035 domain-containing protein [Hafnia alvei]TBM29672.1 DUF4035 domain-containing protein [Hafnia alvei]
MTLALRLGRTVHELTQTITASELKMWIEFDRLSPIGDKRGDIQAALVASSVYRSQGGKATLDDMLLRWGLQPEEDDGGSGLEDFLEKLAG